MWHVKLLSRQSASSGWHVGMDVVKKMFFLQKVVVAPMLLFCLRGFAHKVWCVTSCVWKEGSNFDTMAVTTLLSSGILRQCYSLSALLMGLMCFLIKSP